MNEPERPLVLTSVPAAAGASGTAVLHFGNAEVRPRERTLRVGGQDAAIGGRAFDLLLALIERRDRVVSRNELQELVWPSRVVEDNNLAVQVLTLRKLLGAKSIATVPGRGYRFMLAIDEDTPPQAPPQAEFTSSPAVRADGPAPFSPRGTPPTMLGRDDALMALDHLLAQHQLVTVIGTGGIGKTTLALVAAHSRRAAQRDGAAWVDLSPISQSALLIPTLEQALQLPTTRGERSLPALVASLKPLQLLLVLDNVEYMADEVGRLADAIAVGAPGVRLLVTSQVPLRVSGERLLRLGPLAVPNEDTPPEEAMRHGAVALFVNQAQAADPRFVLTDDNVAAVIDLCRHLDGLALAIKLAATRIAFFGLHGLQQHLADRLRLLGGGSRDAPVRQQTLRAALDWSHGLLAAAEQRVFRALGVFAGGFTLETANALLADPKQDEWPVIEHISALVDHSLVSVDNEDPPRYSLVESAREYALAKLDEYSEASHLRERHARAMWESSERGRIAWRALTDDEVIERYGRDVANLRAAIDWSIAHDPHLAIDLVGASSFVFYYSNLSHEVRRRCEALEPALAAYPNRASVAQFWLAWAWNIANPNAAMRTCAARAAALFRELDNAMDLHSALCYVGFSAFVGSEEAERAMAEAAALERPQWPARLRVTRLFAQGYVHRANGQRALWRDAHARAAALARAAGARSIAALATGDATLADLALGEPERALTTSRALLAEERARRGGRLAFAWGIYARCLVAQGQLAEARAAWTEYFGHKRTASWDGMDAFCASFVTFAAAEKRYAAAARLRGFWLGSLARRGFSQAVAERWIQSLDSSWAPTLRANVDEATIERLRIEGQTLDAEAVCALTLEASDRPP